MASPAKRVDATKRAPLDTANAVISRRASLDTANAVIPRRVQLDFLKWGQGPLSANTLSNVFVDLRKVLDGFNRNQQSTNWSAPLGERAQKVLVAQWLHLLGQHVRHFDSSGNVDKTELLSRIWSFYSLQTDQWYRLLASATSRWINDALVLQDKNYIGKLYTELLMMGQPLVDSTNDVVRTTQNEWQRRYDELNDQLAKMRQVSMLEGSEMGKDELIDALQRKEDERKKALAESLLPPVFLDNKIDVPTKAEEKMIEKLESKIRQLQTDLLVAKAPPPPSSDVDKDKVITALQSALAKKEVDLVKANALLEAEKKLRADPPQSSPDDGTPEPLAPEQRQKALEDELKKVRIDLLKATAQNKALADVAATCLAEPTSDGSDTKLSYNQILSQNTLLRKQLAVAVSAKDTAESKVAVMTKQARTAVAQDVASPTETEERLRKELADARSDFEIAAATLAKLKERISNTDADHLDELKQLRDAESVANLRAEDQFKRAQAAEIRLTVERDAMASALADVARRLAKADVDLKACEERGLLQAGDNAVREITSLRADVAKNMEDARKKATAESLLPPDMLFEAGQGLKAAQDAAKTTAAEDVRKVRIAETMLPPDALFDATARSTIVSLEQRIANLDKTIAEMHASAVGPGEEMATLLMSLEKQQEQQQEADRTASTANAGFQQALEQQKQALATLIAQHAGPSDALAQLLAQREKQQEQQQEADRTASTANAGFQQALEQQKQALATLIAQHAGPSDALAQLLAQREKQQEQERSAMKTESDENARLKNILEHQNRALATLVAQHAGPSDALAQLLAHREKQQEQQQEADRTASTANAGFQRALEQQKQALATLIAQHAGPSDALAQLLAQREKQQEQQQEADRTASTANAGFQQALEQQKQALATLVAQHAGPSEETMILFNRLEETESKMKANVNAHKSAMDTASDMLKAERTQNSMALAAAVGPSEEMTTLMIRADELRRDLREKFSADESRRRKRK